MEFEHYRNFVTIAETGTISAAAQSLHVSQPALSNQLKALEDEFGAPLFVRKPRKMELTDAGEILYERARSMCKLEDSAKKEIAACSVGRRGTIKIGITPNSADTILPELFIEFYKLYPDISFEIYELPSDQLTKMLQDRLLEIAVIKTSSLYLPNIEKIMSVQENYMLFYKEDNPWLTATESQISIFELKDVPLSITRGIQGTFTEFCEMAGFVPRYINVCSSRSLVKMWADQGFAAAIIVSPEPIREEGFCCRPIYFPELTIQRSLSVLKGEKLSLPVETFIEFCKERLRSD